MVNLIDCSKSEFVNQVKGKKLYCFGAGKYLQHFIDSQYGISVEAIIDNYRYANKESIHINGREVRVISADEFVKVCDADCVVVITCLSIEDVLEQLDSIKECDGMGCYVELFIGECTEHTKIQIENKPTQAVIPKKIHYCWFGGKEIPDEYQQYIATWKKYCPDYEIIRWDESNYDIRKSRYVREAYEQEKWAFVTDYARVDILYQEGGIYFDTDVEVIASFDEFLVWDLFCGFERGNYVAWGLGVGAVKKHPILKSLLEIYNGMPFIQADGSFNMEPCPVIQSEVMKRYGFEMNGRFQARNGVAVFPQEFFAPINSGKCYGRLTEYSHSIHHYAASWVGVGQRIDREKDGERIRKIKAHNQTVRQTEHYVLQNSKSEVKRFQIWNCLPEGNTAGSKAPNDIKNIFGRKGYQAIDIHPHNGDTDSWQYKRMAKEWHDCYELVPENSILLLQHPFWQEQRERNEILLKLKEHKHVSIISFVHDVEKLRGIFLSDYMQAEFVFMLRIADVLIVHNEKMKKFFLGMGIAKEKVICLEIFDYLSDNARILPKRLEQSVSIAGNLDSMKSPYLEKMRELAPLKVHLYGPNYTAPSIDRQPGYSGNMIYHGAFSSDMIQSQLTGGFGLVWDGNSLDTCTGATGEYLRYNNPHKLSMYLAAGLPVIIWKEAAAAEYVERHGAGIAVGSLYDIAGELQNVDEDRYSQYLAAVDEIADDIRKGRNTENAIRKAEIVLRKEDR